MPRFFASEANLNQHPIYIEYGDIARHWILKMLVPLGLHKHIISEHLCHDDDVLHELGLSKYLEEDEFRSKDVRRVIRKMHRDLIDTGVPTLPTNTLLAKNIQWLANVVGLNNVEKIILHFRVIVSRHVLLRNCVSRLGQSIDFMHAVNILSTLLNLDPQEIEMALKPDSRLIKTGIISIPKKLEDIFDKIKILPGLADNLFRHNDNSYDLFKDNFTLAYPAKLKTNDYPHIAEDVTVLKTYLSDAIEEKREGVNILIYGTPGSGKTEFAKTLAHELGNPLFEISSEDSSGDPIQHIDRLRSFRLSQHILANNTQRPIILFDEVEDVFKIGESENKDNNDRKGNGIKAWINKTLEGNKLPSLWLSNSAWCLDNAYIRRFDYVIELNTPPRSVRKKILDRYLADIQVSDNWKASAVEHEHLNPAVVERATKVIEIAKSRQPTLHSEKALDRILGNTLSAMGLPRLSKIVTTGATAYRSDVLNTDCEIGEVCEGLREHGSGRLCLYGPPGTGKSAFGRYLAEKLDRPLIVRRASDILGALLGQTEHNMAKMFHEASQENAVLLLDEADTFLQGRSGATRSWEVSQVNEMLTQMESFEGIFIASTNLMESLDIAALRRFDMKVKFGYMKPEQAWQLLLDCASKLDIEIKDSDRAALDQLHLLTPGDYANVMRQSRLRKIRSTCDLIERLAAECQLKPEGMKRSIGFV